MRRLSVRAIMPAALMVLGAAAVALTLAADLLGVGGGGFGAKQITLLAAGAAGLLSGLALATRPGWAYATGWRRQLRCAAEPPGILLLAVWFGLLTGWGQAVVFLVRKEYQGQLIAMGLDYGWMIPLANLVFFIVLGLALALFHRRWPRLASVGTAAFLLAWPAILGLLLLIPSISPLALLVLAAGIAAQVTRLVMRHNRGFSTLVRFSAGWPALLRRPRAENPLPPVAASAPLPQATSLSSPTRRQFLLGATAGIAAVALGTHAGLALTEHRALARLVRPASRLPNVLLIVLDTVRAQSMSLYGYSRPTTPNLERLATQGILFTRAIAPSSWTLPSHASMFTGRFPHEYASGWLEPVVTPHPFLAEVLFRAGYATAGFVANTAYCTREYGLHRGFVHYEDFRMTPGQAFVSTTFGTTAKARLQLIERFGTYRNFGRKSAEQVNQDFFRWLRRETPGPFFAFLNYYDAHDPFLPPVPYGLQFAVATPRGFVTPDLARELNGEGLRELQNAYDASIAYLDDQLGALLEGLAALKVLDNTVVAITSDHGEQFGEHSLIGHGNSLYRSLIHVPLLLLWPGKLPAGMTVREPVSLTDLPATFMDLTGIQPGVDLAGHSLARHWRRPEAEPEPAVYSEVDITWDINKVPSLKGQYQSLVTSEHHYILCPDGMEELYSFDADPEEVTNLAEAPAGRSAIVQFRTLLPQA